LRFFPGPVYLEISERHAVGTTDQRQDVRICGTFLDIAPMPCKIAAVFPDDLDARIVHQR